MALDNQEMFELTPHAAERFGGSPATLVELQEVWPTARYVPARNFIVAQPYDGEELGLGFAPEEWSDDEIIIARINEV